MTKLFEREIEHCGVSLSVSYFFNAAEKSEYLQPPYFASVDVESIKAGGVEIMDILGEAEINEIGEAVAEAHEFEE